LYRILYASGRLPPAAELEDAMKYATVTEARSHLPHLVESMERVALTRHGKPIAVLMDIQDYRNLALAEVMVKDPQRLAAVHRDSLQFGRSGDIQPPREQASTEWTDEIRPEEIEAFERFKEAAAKAFGSVDRGDAKRTLDDAFAHVLAALRVMEARVHVLGDMTGHVVEMVEEEKRAAKAG
jgi:prevent-host-death family protein